MPVRSAFRAQVFLQRFRLSSRGLISASFEHYGGCSLHFTGGGGADVGAFTVSLTMPNPMLNLTNQTSLATVTRSSGIQVNWSGGAAGTYVMITGSSSNTAGASGSFTCFAPQSAGGFLVPAFVASVLPAGTGTLLIENSTSRRSSPRRSWIRDMRLDLRGRRSTLRIIKRDVARAARPAVSRVVSTFVDRSGKRRLDRRRCRPRPAPSSSVGFQFRCCARELDLAPKLTQTRIGADSSCGLSDGVTAGALNCFQKFVRSFDGDSALQFHVSRYHRNLSGCASHEKVST